MNIFIEKLIDFILASLASAIGGVIAVPVTSIISAAWNYIYIDAENGYFKYHPEDTDKRNSMKNLSKRAATLVADILSRRFEIKELPISC